MRPRRLARRVPEARVRVPNANRARFLPARTTILRRDAPRVRLRRVSLQMPQLHETLPDVRGVPPARDRRGPDGIARREDPSRPERVAHVRLRAHGTRRRGMDPVGHGERPRRLL